MMAVEKLFWSDPYLTEADATVTGIDGAKVTLDRSIFFAFSGGQESDYGTIGGFSVDDACIDGKEIIYTLETIPSFKKGDSVTIRIDWERRYKLMRLHMAAELVLVLVMKMFPGIEKIGAHISEKKSRLDFVADSVLCQTLPEIEERALALVAEDAPIISDFSDKAAARRFWRIDGFGSLPCGGTHLKRTGEIGPLRLGRKNIGKGKERIEIELFVS